MSSTTLELHTDAAQSKGYGGIYKSKWLYGAFPDDWKKTKHHDFRIISHHFGP